MYKIILLSLVLLLPSCAKMVLLKNDAGDVQRCDVSALSSIVTGMFMSDRQISQCVEQLQRAGFKKID